MKASETKLQPIIEGTKQYVVPLFQRPYSWDKREWKILWEDLEWLADNPEHKSHFIGSLVTMPTSNQPESVTKYLLIDGQQRVTTIFILLTLLRDLAKQQKIDLYQEIEQTLLFNAFKKGHEHYKLLPTQSDREEFFSLLKSESTEKQSQISLCYQFFEKELKKNKAIQIDSLFEIIKSRLSVVSIVLDYDDNPHLVFESLNAKGRPLTQADLIRNYFLMRIPVEIQEESYEKYWRPMQANLGDSLTEFVRHYLMKSGALVKQSDVYFTLKDKIGSNDALATLKDMAKFASYYHKILNPQFEANEVLQTALEELTSLDVGTAYPFLLNCYDDYQQGLMTPSIFLQIIQLLENFIIRRFLCNAGTKQLAQIFSSLYARAQAQNPNDIYNGLRVFLQGKDYPKDAEISQRMVSDKMYGAGDRLNKAKFILKRLEQHFAHKEKVDVSNLTIEHIMPQTLSKEWQESMGQDYQTDHDLYLHVIGNLTLTAYNSELSNSSFAKKKELLKQSHLDINKYFTNCESWTKHDIEARSGYLAEIALQVWPYFGDTNKSADPKEVTGKKPKTVTIMGQSFPVTSWRDVEECSLNVLLDLEPDLFAKLQKDYPNFIGSDYLRFRSHRQLKNGLYIEMNLSAQDIYRFCTQAFESIDLSSDDWFIEFVE